MNRYNRAAPCNRRTFTWCAAVFAALAGGGSTLPAQHHDYYVSAPAGQDAQTIPTTSDAQFARFMPPPSCAVDRLPPIDSAGDAPPPDLDDVTQTPPQNFGGLGADQGAIAGTQGPGSGIIGDFYFESLQVLDDEGAGSLGTPDFVSVVLPARRKLFVDDNQVLPQTRFTFSFNHYSNAQTPGNSVAEAPDSISADRYLFGWEQAFFGGLMSLDFRLPFARGLDDVQLNDAVDNGGTEIGNLSLAWKALLWRSRRVAVSGGLGMLFPTGGDFLLLTSHVDPSEPSVFIGNNAFHLQPYLGTQYTPMERAWISLLASADLAMNGNQVDFIFANGSGIDGIVNEQHLLYFDLAAGYWWWRDSSRLLAGFASIFELHYATTMNPADIVLLPDPMIIDEECGIVTNPGGAVNVLNATAGLRFQFGRSTYLTLGGVVPLRTVHRGDKQFDFEFVTQLTFTPGG